MAFDRLGSVGPVTALCVHGNYIIAGCGSVVQVYRAGTGELKASLTTLPCTTVHGLRLGPLSDGKRSICVFGAKCVRILHIDTKQSGAALGHCDDSVSLESVTAAQEFEDWIWDVVWLQKGEGWTLGLALAHNVVLQWDWQTGAVLQRVTCTEKCILYCAHFIGNCWSDLVLAAGTVFNQVVLWAPGSGDGVDGSDDQPQPVLQRLTGHQGVIFSVFYHPGLQRICSVSDDRSIIMYQLRFPQSLAQGPSNDASGVADWKQVTVEPMLTVFGHSGRVWDVVLLSQVFVSVGEDAHCIVWGYSGDILHKHKGHKGRSIWSLAASEDESFVVTGGGDSSIRQWRLQGKNDLPLTQVQLTIPDTVKVCDGDFVRTVALWDYNTVVLMTNAGSLLSYSVTSAQWQTLIHDADFASYSTLAVSTNRTYLAVGSITGHVRVRVRGQGHRGTVDVGETKTGLHSGKICGLTWVDDDHVLTTGLQGHCVLASFKQTPQSALTVSPVAQLELPASKHRWVVSACLLSSPSSSSPSPETLVCGDRSGSVHCYQLKHTTTGAEVALPPAQTFPKIHGKAGVTCVCFHDDIVFTSGRDGHYRRWTVNNGQLQLLNSSRVFKGFDWIDRLLVEKEKLYVLGFYSSKFIVWDQTQGESQLQVECGGGHRAWDCLPQLQGQGQGYRFLFIKAREVVMVTGGQSSGQDIIKPPLHGMKVWDMKHLYTCTDNQGGVHHVVCTGSEDTTLSLGTLHCRLPAQAGSLQWMGQHTLHAHLSSVRALAAVQSAVNTPGAKQTPCNSQTESTAQAQTCSTDSHYFEREKNSQRHHPASTVVFSGGGRAQIQAWRVTVTTESNSSSLSQNLRSRTDQSCSSCIAENTQHQHQAVDSEINHQVREKGPSEMVNTQEIQENSSSKAFSISGGCLDSAQTSVSSNLTSSKEMAEGSTDKQISFTTSYEHLGGCFLGESRHKRSHKPWKTRYLKLDPETRIMSLAAVAAQQLDHRLCADLHLLAAAGSDGVLRLFLFDESQRQFTLLCQSSHHRGCILKVFIHLHPKPSGPHSQSTPDSHPLFQPILLSAATDGRIAVWDLRPVAKWLLTGFGQLKEASDGYPDVAASQRHIQESQSHSAVKKEAGRSEKDFAESPDHAFSQEHQEVTGEECPGDDNEADDDGVDSGDSESDSDQTLAHFTSIQQNVTRIQYVGDGPPSSLQQVLARTHPALSLSGRKGEGALQEESANPKGWSPNQEIEAHQSGINSLHVKSLEDGTLLMASGGDDNALTIHRVVLTHADTGTKNTDTLAPSRDDTGTGSRDILTADGGGCSVGVAGASSSAGCGRWLDVTSTVTKPDAHDAQITGVRVLSRHLVLTASIDQRLTLWRLTQNFQLQFENCRFVDIADLSNVEVWQHQNTVYIGLCGEGVALLSIQCQDEDHNTVVS